MQSLFVLHAAGIRDVTRNPQEEYAVHLAAAAGFRDGLLYMLKNMGSDIDARNGQGATPLMLAIENDRLDVASALLARGARVSRPSSMGSAGVHTDSAEDPLARQARAASMAPKTTYNFCAERFPESGRWELFHVPSVLLNHILQWDEGCTICPYPFNW